jgi:hypothetical protein
VRRSVIVSRGANGTGSAAQYLAEASNTSAAVTLADDCSLAGADWHIEPIPSTVDCAYDLGDSPHSPATFDDSQVGRSLRARRPLPGTHMQAGEAVLAGGC